MHEAKRLALALAALGMAPDPAGAAGGTLLVGNKGEDSLSIIELENGRQRARVPTGRMPHEIAVSPDGRQAAVVAYGGSTIDIVDIASARRTRTIDLAPNEGPHGLVWLADGRLVATAERSQSLTVVDTRHGDKVSAIPTGQQGTHMVAVSPDARWAYTANIQAGTVSVIDLAAGRKLRDVAVGGEPEAIALARGGRELWVGDLRAAHVQAFDTAEFTAADESGYRPTAIVTAIVKDGTTEEIAEAVAGPLEKGFRDAFLVDSDIKTGRAVIRAHFRPGTKMDGLQARVEAIVRAAAATFPKERTEIEIRLLGTKPVAAVATGAIPIRLAASPDGRWIVSSNMGSGSLTVVDAATRAKVREIAVSGVEAAGQVTILFSADGRRIYAAETGRDQVAEIDFATGRVLRRLAAGRNGDGLAIAP